MTPNSKQHDDTKILLAVAGVVVAGAAGLALLAGLSSERQAAATREAHAATTGSRPAVEGPAMPALAVASGRDAEAPVDTAAFGRAIATPATAAIEVAADPEPEAFSIEPGENLVAGGLAAWNAKDYGRAAAYFEAQTTAKASDAWAHYMLGLSRWKAGRADDAVPALERSAELDPAFIRTPINLSRIQNDRGEFAAALAAAEAALSIDPEDAQARFLEGRSLYNLGRTDEARVALERSVVGDDGNGYAHNLLGLVLLEAGEAARAADVLERAAELEPDVAFIQNNLGMAAELCGERATAVAAYRRAVELRAGYARAAANLARLEPLMPVMPVMPDVPGAPDAVAEVPRPAAAEVVETASAGNEN